MQSRSKNIAKNTIYLYIRMFFIMIVTFFTSRVVLDKLGVVDFGIQNVVGGVASLFVFFRSSLSNATQRYLSVALGEKDLEKGTLIVRQHFTIYIVIGVIAAILAELFGLWLVEQKLVIPPDRLIAARWVLHFSIIGFVVSIMDVVPYAMLVAHEDFKVYSYLGIFECVAKLAIAFVISVVAYDRLIVYSFLLLLIIVFVFLFNYIFCKVKYEECSYKLLWNPLLIKEMFGFIGWNVVGTAVYTINDAGTNLLLNMFFGPVVNAARGVSFQVSNAVNQFGQNFFTAVRPQIFKSYAENNEQYLLSLFYRSSKFSIYLLWLMTLPVMLKADAILGIWLKEVPEGTSVFLIWVLAYSLVNALVEPIWALILAVGDLKRYSIVGNLVFLMAFPISYVALKLGAPALSVFIIMFVVRLVFVFVVLYIVSGYIHFEVPDYLRKVFYPILIVILLSSLVSYYACIYIRESLWGILLTVIISSIICGASIWSLGINRSERELINSMISNKLNSFIKRNND